jgi:hypothetical protein
MTFPWLEHYSPGMPALLTTGTLALVEMGTASCSQRGRPDAVDLMRPALYGGAKK